MTNTKVGNWKRLFLILIIFVLNSCASQFAFENSTHTLLDGASDPLPSLDDVKKEIEVLSRKLEQKESKKLNAKFITEGLLALAEKRLAQANDSFQRALKFQPRNAILHKLNALTHQLRGDAGDPSQYKSAEIGYGLASRLDPGDGKTHYFMGVLQFNQFKFQNAQEHFSNAIIQDPNQPEYFMGLAASSYYLGELGRAYANIEKALSLDPNDPAIVQASGIIYASLGAFNKATSSSHSLGTVSKMRQEYLQKRISDWKTYYSQNKIQNDRQLKRLFAQNLDIFGLPEGGMFDSTSSNPIDPTARKPGEDSDSNDFDLSDLPPLPLNNIPTPIPAPKGKPRTSKLQNKTHAKKTAVPSPTSIPVKKKIKIPAMAMVDVAIIATEEIYKSGKGVNLLDSLNIFFAGDQFLQINEPIRGGNTHAAPTANDVLTMKLGTAAAGITYSLNIFSDDYDRYEVIARPTIMVEDRKKSKFYSGGTLHIVVEGGVAGSGSMQPLSTGVKLEVTPKFLDEKTIDLSVFAERAYLEASLSQVSSTITGTTFASTTKTNISAHLTLRYDETMVLSGLSEQEKEIVDDKVPLLGDIPFFQYFFRRQTKTSVKKTVLIFLTPRRAGLSYEDGNPISEDAKKKNGSIEKLERNTSWLKPAPHLKALVKHLGKYEFFNHYRKGDMQLENWAGEGTGTVKDAIRKTLDYLYIYYNFEKNDKSSL